MAPTLQDVLHLIEREGIDLVDLKFSDLHGTWQHYTISAGQLTAEAFSEGVAFDGSSIRGWQSIDESDMAMVPAPGTAWIDPFHAHRTLSLICTIRNPRTGAPYRRCPRSLAQRAVEHLHSSGLADAAWFGPEPEFFVFDDVRYDSAAGGAFFQVDSIESPWNSGRLEEGGNLAYKIPPRQGYLPVSPADTLHDMRSEMLLTLASLGVPVEKHHHEVAAAQHELGLGVAELLPAADQVMICKYVVRNVARKYGKTATFMPKPVFSDNGNGMHVHQSLWKEGQPLFHGEGTYADLSQTARWYIGGLLRHAPSLLAFTNPSTNSYRRLVPGFEAPVHLAYSSGNRSAAVRIPLSGPNPRAKRLEFRTSDALANPYLAFSALLLAGLDGIRNRIDPGPAIDEDLFHLPPEERRRIASVPVSLEAALEALRDDRTYLLAGGVFDEEFLDHWIELKLDDVRQLRQRPHPHEFSLYYDA